jgi:ribonuclease T1
VGCSNVGAASGEKAGKRGAGKWALAALAIVLGTWTGGAAARGLPAESETIALTDLPAQARQTHRLILEGGPFPYEKDGTVFLNRERLLPRHPRGFYREYTVKTPGSRNRGARRIVCGGTQPKTPDACYYTADHYASFRRIVP